MDQRIAVQAFKCGTHAEGRLRIAAEKGGARCHQERPKTFSSIQHGVARGVQQVLRARDLVGEGLCRQERRQQALDLCGRIA